MQILRQQEAHWKLRIESEDDLWVLVRLASPGRNIAMLGERRDTTTAESGSRAKAAERKKMWIELRILNTEYQTYSDLLRIHGIIEQAPMDIGSHHTHLIEVGDEVELTSLVPYPSFDHALLKEAVDSANKTNISLIVVENDEIVLFYVTPRGLKESSTWAMRGGGKRVDTKSSSVTATNFRAKVIKEITESLAEQTPLILCGPGHARDVLLGELKSAGQTRFMTSIATSMSGRAGANELLREGLAGSLLEQYAITKEIKLLEEAWTRLSTKGAIAYGHQELLKALEEGAIETALITADLLRDGNEKIGDMTWSKWAEGLEAIGAELVQCSTDHDSGQQLLGMGGAVALLRYRM